MLETLRFTRGNLPHWLVADHAYFVKGRSGELLADLGQYKNYVARQKENGQTS